MLTLFGELRSYLTQRLQEPKRRDRLGRLVHPDKQGTQLRGQSTVGLDGPTGAEVGAVRFECRLELWDGPESLKRGVHVAGVAEVGQTRRLFELDIRAYRRGLDLGSGEYHGKTFD